MDCAFGNSTLSGECVCFENYVLSETLVSTPTCEIPFDLSLVLGIVAIVYCGFALFFVLFAGEFRYKLLVSAMLVFQMVYYIFVVVTWASYWAVSVSFWLVFLCKAAIDLVMISGDGKQPGRGDRKPLISKQRVVKPLAIKPLVESSAALFPLMVITFAVFVPGVVFAVWIASPPIWMNRWVARDSLSSAVLFLSGLAVPISTGDKIVSYSFRGSVYVRALLYLSVIILSVAGDELNYATLIVVSDLLILITTMLTVQVVASQL